MPLHKIWKETNPKDIHIWNRRSCACTCDQHCQRIYIYMSFQSFSSCELHIPSVSFSGGSCDVRCVSFCPSQPDHLLAGCSDGSIRLHHIKRSRVMPNSICIIFIYSRYLTPWAGKPLLTWSNTTIEGAAVSMLQWIQHRPGVFIVHDSCSTIYLWCVNDRYYVMHIAIYSV